MKNRRVLVLVGLVLLAIAVTLVLSGVHSRNKSLAALRTDTEESSIEDVSVLTPQQGDATRDIDLPGDVSAWYEAPIYAQVSGYVKMWYKDYGAHVRRGDVLANINVPSLDAQYRAAKAKVDVANTRLSLAELTARRWKNLEGTQAVSKQMVDVQAANAKASGAEAEAAQQEFARLQALENFRTIVAPFDGIVTARSINVGDYVGPEGGELGDKGNPAELFSVADVHKLRIFVSVPQDYINILKKGVTAEISVPQNPGKIYHAEFLTDASALDKDSRTVTTELVMDNPDNQLWPGSYARVHFHVPTDEATLLIPENALIFQEEGEQVAIVDSSNRIVLRKVKVGRNLGKNVEILSGIQPTDRVVNNPSAGLLDGEQVRVVPATKGYNQTETSQGQ